MPLHSRLSKAAGHMMVETRSHIDKDDISRANRARGTSRTMFRSLFSAYELSVCIICLTANILALSPHKFAALRSSGKPPARFPVAEKWPSPL